MTESFGRNWITDLFARCRNSRQLVLFIVFIALFLDNMLLSTVVPIIPNFLYSMQNKQVLVNDTRQVLVNVTEPAIIETICYNVTKRNNSNETEPEGFMKYLKTMAESYVPPKPPSYVCENVTIAPKGYTESYVTEANLIYVPQSRHQFLKHASVIVGLIFASKAVVQLITNPFLGPITNRLGYSIPMFTGFVVMLISTVGFAFANSYSTLFLARAVQGIGSACSSVSGMGMLADRYPNDAERGKAMGVALGGLAMGVLIGPPFGGIMYQFGGKELPFLILAAIVVIDGCLQLIVLQLKIKPEAQEGTALKDLIRDPYILVAAGSITFSNMGIAMLEPSLPMWMSDTMGAPEWEQGVAFLPASVSYLIGTNIFGLMAHKIGRWLTALIGMLMIGFLMISIPFSKNIFHLIVPQVGVGFGIGMVDSSMMPLMGHLVDLRHVSVYGSVYAIADVAFCLGFAVGPALSGGFVKCIGFSGMIWVISTVNILYAPTMLFLRNLPVKEEKMSLVMNEQCPVQYVTYNQSKRDTTSEDDDGGY
ncbi:synaptic vesicular amine transporter-like [Argonauta hians]